MSQMAAIAAIDRMIDERPQRCRSHSCQLFWCRSLYSGLNGFTGLFGLDGLSGLNGLAGLFELHGHVGSMEVMSQFAGSALADAATTIAAHTGSNAAAMAFETAAQVLSLIHI